MSLGYLAGSGRYSGSVAAAISLVSSISMAASSCGSPRIEMSTVIGSGSEISVTQSNSPLAITWSSRSRAIIRV
jgi:hypothetical protein